MDRRERIKELWTKGFFGWRLEKQKTLHNGKKCTTRCLRKATREINGQQFGNL
jgi:hypothetical protein